MTEPATTTRLTAIAAAVPASVAGTFANDGPLDAPTLARVRDLDIGVDHERFDRVWCAPETAAQETADGLGLTAVTGHDALRACDFGAWAGRALSEVQADDPAAFERWATDVEARPPGGESMADVLARVSTWLDGTPSEERVAVVASALVVRALVVAAIRAPAHALAHVDVEPLAMSRLTRHDGHWRLRTLNARFGH